MSRLIFGSCSSQHYQEQPLWPVIQNRDPTAFVWGGDAVYADDRGEWDGFQQHRLDATPDYLRELYQQQRDRPDYSSFLDTGVSIFGTMDDHDYGTDNGDRTYPWRRESGIEFVRFLGLPEESPMAKRAERGSGVYGVQVYDFSRPKGQQLLSDEEAGLDPDVIANSERIEQEYENQLVAVFVLDVRTNKTPWSKSYPERLSKDSNGDFLGEEQWAWFEEAIGRSHAAVNVVVTGLQVHAERFYDANVVENWSGFPRAQHRLHQALLQHNVRAPILISGDVHHAQMMRKDCRKQYDSESYRPLYEITTSGMTHSWGTRVCGRATLNPFCHIRYFNAIYRPLAILAHWINPWNELILDSVDNSPQYSLDLNVAELDFDWERDMVKVSVLGEDDEVLLRQDWSMKGLSSIEPMTSLVSDGDFHQVQQNLKDMSILQPNGDDWTCAHYRGLPDRAPFAFGIIVCLTLLFILSSLPFCMCFQVVRQIFFPRTKVINKASEKTD